jgi:uncharacterized protein (TIGR00251 family)
VIALNETAEGTIFAVRVQPRARKNAIVGELGDALKISLTAPPVDGRANEACLDFFSDFLSLPRSAIRIISGETSRNKVIRVSGCTASQIRAKLNSSFQ